MSEEQQQQEKTEQPTVKRREDFRKKGQVAQSKEIHTAALLTVSLILWYFYAPRLWASLNRTAEHIFYSSGTWRATNLSIMDLFVYCSIEFMKMILPVLAVVLVVGALSSIAQIGFLLTGEPLKFDLKKLDPIKGAKKFVSKKTFVEFAKSILKVVIVGYVAFKTVKAEFSQGLLLVDAPAETSMAFLGSVAFWVMLKTCGIMAVLSLLDYAFVRYELEQKMKMTKQEQKEEHKESEGDPTLKSRIRQTQQEMARRRMMDDVPKADVIITNPTHLAIALKYDPTKMAAPEIVAKGAENVAFKIREIAKEKGIPIIENKPLARALFKVKIGKAVPEELFKAVADVLVYVGELQAEKGNTKSWMKKDN